MGVVIKEEVFYTRLNGRTLWENRQPTVPLDPKDFGEVVAFKKRPGRALVVVDPENDDSLFADVEQERPSDSRFGDD